MLAGLLTPTAMIGSHFGGHLTHRLNVKWVRVAFIALMVLSVYKMFTPKAKPRDAAERLPVAARTQPAISTAR